MTDRKDDNDDLTPTTSGASSSAANLGRDSDDFIIIDDEQPTQVADDDAADSEAQALDPDADESSDTAADESASDGAPVVAAPKAKRPAKAKGSAESDEFDVVAYDDELPFELRDDRDVTGDEPKTGLVAEFRDLTGRQAAWLVSNRETGSVSRSPLFYVTALLIGLGVIAGLVFAATNKAESDSGSLTLASVGFGAQAQAAEQQLGVKVKDVNTVEEAQQLVRDHQADAAYVPDPTGQGSVTIIALDSEPTAILKKISPDPNITYLEPPAVATKVAVPLAWAMGGLLAASILTLGASLFSNLRTEKRNRITEIIAATISPRAAAWGRVWGLTVLSLGYLVIAAGVALLGMSIIGQTSVAVAMLPAVGWFAGTFAATVFASLSLYLWAATVTGERARKISYGIVAVVVVAGALVPLLFVKSQQVLSILAWIPFTSPVATALRYFAHQSEWWSGLVGIGITVVVGLILFALGARAYRASLLQGGLVRKTATVRKFKDGAKADAAKASDSKADAKASDDDATEAGADSADAEADVDAKVSAASAAKKSTGTKSADTKAEGSDTEA